MPIESDAPSDLSQVDFECSFQRQKIADEYIFYILYNHTSAIKSFSA